MDRLEQMERRGLTQDSGLIESEEDHRGGWRIVRLGRVLLDVVRTVLARLPLAHYVEVEAGIISLGELEKSLEASWKLHPLSCQRHNISCVPLGIGLQWRRLPLAL